MQQKARRNRGVILTLKGWDKLQTAKAKTELEKNGGDSFSLEELSDRTQLALHTISKILGRLEPVDKSSLQSAFAAFNLELCKSDYTRPSPPEDEVRRANPQYDWGEAPDVSVFYGRAEELLQLRQWVLEQRCRLVALLGIGGIGKSTLAVKLGLQIQSEFEVVVWRSLQNAPSVQELLTNILQFLLWALRKEIVVPESFDGKLSKLMEFLVNNRCLLILDNFETVLSVAQVGQYRPGYEGYGQLLKCIGEVPHTSCVLLTSREKPREMVPLEGDRTAVRSLPLKGLNPTEAQELFQHKGQFTATQGEWQKLIEHYGGNPLALKMVAAGTQELFDGKITPILEYIQQGITVFEDIYNLLQCQFQRLSVVEAEVMYWLAINREPVAITELAADMVTSSSQRQLPRAIKCLLQRSLIEKSGEYFFLQPVLMEYTTQRLIEQVTQELVGEKSVCLPLFQTHALIKATAKDYVRERQNQLIVQPLLEQMLLEIGSQQQLVILLQDVLEQQRNQAPILAGYAGGNIINLLTHLQVNLKGYDFSNLTIWQADLRRVKLHHVNFKNADLTKSIFSENFGGILSVAFSPDSTLLAIGDTNGEIHLYRTFDWKQILTCKGHNNWVVSLAFCSNGSRLASSSIDRTIKCWDIISGQCLQTLEGHENEVWSIAFSADNDKLVSGSDDHTIKLWDINTGECLRTFQGHTSWVCSVALCPDGQRVASGSDDHTIKLWDINIGKCLKTFQGHDNGIRSVTFSPDGQMLASGGDDHLVKLWNINTGKCITTFKGHSNEVYSVKFSPQGDILASASNDRTIKLWNISSNRCFKTLHGHSSHIFSVAFSPQNGLLASGSEDQTVKIWSIQTGECLKTLKGYTSQLLSITFSPDGKTLASGSRDSLVKLWNVNTGRDLHTFLGHRAAVRSVAFSPQGEILASGSDDQTIKLWDINTSQVLHTFFGHRAAIWSIAFHPHGTMLASGSDDQTIKLWNINTSQVLHTFLGHRAAIWSIAFHPHGTILASGSSDHTIKLWNTITTQCEVTLEGHTSWVWSIAFSPHGELIASTSPDGTLRLWSMKTFECLQVLPIDTAWLQSITFSPDSRILASCSYDYTVKLWNISTGECFQSLQGHTGRVWSVVFCADNQILASSSEDETIRIWSIETGECLKILKPELPYEQMNIMGVQGLTSATISTLKLLGAINKNN